MVAAVFTPYTTGINLFGAKPTWLTSDLDIQRIQSYQLYEQVYWTVPDVFKLTFRGTNDLAIYIPTARTIIDTINRYTGTDFVVNLTDTTPGGSPSADVLAARLAFHDLFARERFLSKFGGAKRYGLIRGDWIWHLTADPTKPPGKRISIVALDPGMYFPITDDNDVDEVIGCHLVEQISTPDGPRIHRLTYRKANDDTGSSTGITVEEALFELDKWEGPNNQPSKVIQPPTLLHPAITALPVYHIKNFEEPGNPFGSSEIRGFERLMGAVNQTISDEDLTLALEGIGMYTTDAPEPTDENGQVVPWSLGPGRVIQHPEGTTFERVDGVRTVVPYGDHFNRLMSALKEAAATPDVAIGSVDVKIAASGIALALQLQPLLAKAAEKNVIIIDVHNQMMYDILNGWYPAYEQTTFSNVAVSCAVGSAIPIDRAERVSELNDMLDHKVIDTQYYREEMTKLGYAFPADIQQRVDTATAAAIQAQAAVFGATNPLGG